MDDEQLADLHRFLAEHHRKLAKEAALDVVQQYHSDLAQRLADEAALISRRTAIAQRLREGEQRKKDDRRIRFIFSFKVVDLDAVRSAELVAGDFVGGEIGNREK